MEKRAFSAQGVPPMDPGFQDFGVSVQRACAEGGPGAQGLQGGGLLK